MAEKIYQKGQGKRELTYSKSAKHKCYIVYATILLYKWSTQLSVSTLQVYLSLLKTGVNNQCEVLCCDYTKITLFYMIDTVAVISYEVRVVGWLKILSCTRDVDLSLV